MSSFDDIIRQKAQGHEAPVAADAWNRISGKRRRKKPAAWFILPLLIVAGGILWFVWNQNRTTSTAISTAGEASKNSAGKSNAAFVSEAKIPEAPGSSVHPDGNQLVTDAEQLIAGSASRETSSSPASAQTKRTTADMQNRDVSVIQSQTRIRKLQTKQQRSSRSRYQLQTTQGAAGQNDDPSSASVITEVSTGSDLATTALKPGELAGMQEPAVTINNPTARQVHTDAAKINPEPVRQNESPKPGKTDVNTASQKSTHKRKWWIEPGVTLLFPVKAHGVFPAISRNTTSFNTRTVFTPDQFQVTLKPSFAFSMMAAHEFGRRWQWAAGLQYLQMNEQLYISGPEQTTQFTQVSRLDNSSGTSVLIQDTVETISTGIRNVHAVNQLRFIELPVLVRYQLSSTSSRIQWSLQGGFSLNYLASYINSIQPAFVAQTPVKDQRYGINFFGGITINGPLRKRLQWYLQPQGRLSLKHANSAKMLQTYPLHWFGMGMGIRIPLNH